VAPHYTSPPLVPEEFAEFCAAMTRRYGAGSASPALPRVATADVA
jgi:hypothetical protein